MAESIKNLAVLGSTGTIGLKALQFVRQWPERFRVVGLAAGERVEALAEQALEFKPRLVSVASPQAAAELKNRLTGTGIAVLHGQAGLEEVAAAEETEVALSAVAGFAGLAPTLAAAQAGKTIALSNKESLVAGGELVTGAARKSGAVLLPVDSEHSAIYQCLQGHRRTDLDRILLTASGGPFRDLSRDELARVTPAQALDHPNWDMGPKVTIDSATLMNKGLEAIEAAWLFGLKADEIEIVVHPQSIVHSAVEFIDGSVIAQLSRPDMLLPIAYALTYPERLPLDGMERLDLISLGQLTFERPDLDRFPCLALALESMRLGGLAPTAVNAADEVAVAAFLAGRIGLPDIPRVIEAVLAKLESAEPDSLAAIIEADAAARRLADQAAAELTGRGGSA